jgi:RNA polymerase sigma-70 factor (ECF subfamily)
MSNPSIVSRFDEIYNSTKKSVLAFITAKCAHTADINDIFQETYMELYVVLSKRGTDYVINDKAFVLRRLSMTAQALSRLSCLTFCARSLR